ncbi:cyclin-dependent kinase inhibitor far1 [Rhizopus stolonifer]|uniref:Cyclin-dependent kinase inhibitor far1 n=1 Tax=Rhizopus stolonifer TaxID=4846 RepID=A0A367KUH7_RHIST|nr:cyclin-dependent kinase inhibitor far1 [Rhizopus stolonifer]
MSVPTISITNPDLESKDYMASGTVTPTTPDSPTVFDVVKEIENSDPFPEDEAITLTNDFVIDEQDPKQKTIQSFYHQKSILITGATGFIGKAALWKIIHSLHDSVDKIFLLLRPSSRQHQRSASGRLQDDILLNKAFVSLRRSMGTHVFDEFIEEKVYPIFGDITKPNLGLSDLDLDIIHQQVNIIFHCAGNVDGNERLEDAVKINALGTMHLLELANQCHSMAAFVHLSNLQSVNNKSPEEKTLYPLPKTPTEPQLSATKIVQQIVDGSPVDHQHFRSFYSNAYLYSKSLAEHVLLEEIQKHRQQETQPPFPIAMMRLGPVGPSIQEPLMGWADGVNGVNGTLLLTGRGSRVIQPHVGDSVADVVPVDYVVRLMIGCAATLSVADKFEMPKVASLENTHHHHRRTPSSTSRMSMRGSIYGLPKIYLPGIHETPMLPMIYQVSMASMRPLTWRVGYDIMRDYWTKATHVNLPPAKTYFNPPQRQSIQGSTSTPTRLSRARTVMNSLRGYMNTSSQEATSHPPTVTPIASQSSERIKSGPPSAMAHKRNSHRLSRTVDKAAKLATTMRDSIYTNTVSQLNEHTTHLSYALKTMDASLTFDPHAIVPEDADSLFWSHYLTNACYGIHYFVCQETNLRVPTPVDGWHCAIQAPNADVDDEDNGYYQLVIARQVNSVVFSQDQIEQRTARMVSHIKTLLVNNTWNPKETDDAWLTDLDDALDDWCQDEDVMNPEKDRRISLGKWRRKVGSSDESVKIIVLNDKRVNQAVTQITQKAGVPKQTAVNEALKILLRMSERTQLAFVWFAGSFLKSLLDDMFDHVRIADESLRLMRQATMGKRVVYVPVSKSLMDPLVIWYMAIRYHLPVPALACDEAMSQMGPMSDVYRLAGAYYVKRDKSKRSPLNSAVTAAYTQVLLREHGALSFCLERYRSRTGKFQEAYADGFVDMTGRSSTSMVSRIVSAEIQTPPDSPDSTTSTTTSMDSNMTPSPGQKKIHKDVVFIPINITYENVPELPHLIDEVLDQQPTTADSKGRTRSASQSGPPTALPPSMMSPPIRSNGLTRPSEAKDRRKTLLEGLELPKKYGRITLGVGPLVSVQEVAEEFSRKSDRLESYETELVAEITKRVHDAQCKGTVVSPVSMVAGIVLYGRATHGVCIGKIKDLLEWLRHEIIQHQFAVDWQAGEDVDTLILTAFKLLDEPKNLIIDGRDINDDTNIRVNDHADNVMALSYYANQMSHIFLLDAFFAVIYLSFSEETVLQDEFKDRFCFLVQLLEKEFVIAWDLEEKLDTMIEAYIKKRMLRLQDNRLVLLVNMENDAVHYEQLIFLASLVYPTIDAYWIASCSLSALEAVPMLPRCIVPMLTQWIATHLITGRRTIYREVLSTESSKTAVDVFMSMGFLTEIHAKEKLSPDAQILLHELGIPTSEILIELAGQNSDGGKTPISPQDPEGMMAVMAQIQMNRANSNMADLCQQIDSYRLGAASQRESFQNAQVFQKCLKQIKGILHANSSFAKRRHIELPEDEDGLAQLVYSLLASSAPAGDRAAHARALRRISEAYNLR